MIRVPISIIAFFISMLSTFAQTPFTADTSSYKNRKLKLSEINFVGSYYSQNGNNSAVTGGIGTEQLTDFSNLVELRFAKTDGRKHQHSVSFQVGVDAYTSASSDKIDPNTISSASRSDTRIYPTVTYSVKNDSNRFIIGGIGYLSTEFDYFSLGPGIFFTKFSKDRNKEFTVKLQSFFDKLDIILPIELRGNPDIVFNTDRRTTYNVSMVYSGVINKRTQGALLLDITNQNGLLSMPFNRVYFSDNSESVEKLPDNRFKVPFGFRLNYFLGDRIILRSFYRYYFDNWNIKAHTISLETAIKITPFLSLTPGYRFYTQTAAKYFAAFKEHATTDEFYTSDYDLSGFQSHLLSLTLRKVSAEGILGIKKLKSVEIRYTYYHRTTKLTANCIALFLKLK